MRKLIAQETQHGPGTRCDTGDDLTTVIGSVQDELATRTVGPFLVEIEHQRNDAGIVVTKTITMRPIKGAGRVVSEMQFRFPRAKEQRFIETTSQHVHCSKRFLLGCIDGGIREPERLVAADRRVNLLAVAATDPR